MSAKAGFGVWGRTAAMAACGAVIAALTVAAPARAADGGYARTAQVAQQAIERALAATGATSVTAGLTDTSGLLWQGTAGVIDARGGRPGPTTEYGIGSTSKMLATAAVMQLVDAGLVGLDQPVVRYLPQFTMRSPQYRQVTVRMLLDHSAGLPGSAYADAFTTVPFDGYADEVLANLARSVLKTTPGAMSVYCNDCFTLAGEVVGQVARMPFTSYVERRLLAPLGMTHSQYVTSSLPSEGTVARVVSAGRTQPLEVTNVYASGGLMSTPSDMLAFARMLMNGGVSGGTRVLTGTSIAHMGRSQLESTLDPITRNVWNYGLGWDTVSDLSLAAVGVRGWVKGGDTTDYHSGLVIAPQAGLAAFVAGAGTFSSSVAEAVAEEILLSALVDRGDIPAMPDRLGPQQPGPATPTEDDINAMLGTFLGTPDISHRLVRGPGSTLALQRLVGDAWTPSPTTLSFRTDGAWWPDAASAQYLRSVSGWGRTYLVIGLPQGYGNGYGEQVLGQRVESTGPTAPAWHQRMGQWLAATDSSSSTLWLGSPVTTVSEIPGLPGYVNVAGASPVDARSGGVGTMFLQVPLMFGRDLDDLVVVRPGLMRMGSSVMVQREGLAAIPEGRSAVAIGADGRGEWRAIPMASRLVLRGATAWYVYDEDVALVAHGVSGRVTTPAGGLLLVFGKAGSSVSVQALPAG